MRVVAWVSWVSWVWIFAAFLGLAGCDSAGPGADGTCAGSSQIACDPGTDPRMCVGARRIGCPCSTERQFVCIQHGYSGSGIWCWNGAWEAISDDPCRAPYDAGFPPADAASDALADRDAVGSDGRADHDAAKADVPEDTKSCADAGGLSKEGCSCTTQGLYECVGGSGVMCNRGVWERFEDGPCWQIDAGNQCNEEREALGCRCRILGQRICVNGQGLQCSDGSGRWGNDPVACGDSGRPDADANDAAEWDVPADGRNCADASGSSKQGCPCSPDGLYECSAGSGTGIVCSNGTWATLIDGPCSPRDGDTTCTDEVVGCHCPILAQRICVNGQGLRCDDGNGRWGTDPSACADSGSADADAAPDITIGD